MDFKKLINRYIYRNNGIKKEINRNNLGENKIIQFKPKQLDSKKIDNNMILEIEKKIYKFVFQTFFSRFFCLHLGHFDTKVVSRELIL